MGRRGGSHKSKRKSGDKRLIRAVDLFCGVGGLTRGLEKAGIDVCLGVDIDPACEFPFTANSNAEFSLKSVADLSASELRKSIDGAPFTLLAGCAPCQPFSTYQQKLGPSDGRWHLLEHFARLARELKPDLITMENVPNLRRQDVFHDFVETLENLDFHVTYEVVDCVDYGVPQQRQRLVLLASRLGPIELIRPNGRAKLMTVRDAINGLPKLEAGGVCKHDPFHQSSELSKLNLKRIRASKPGGSWRDWNNNLVADCHKRSTGKSYPSVYGRMAWDEPAPTVTTQFFGFGSGRFGHPQQDRAISLREGAILQSFPKGYKFVPKGQPIHRKTIGRLIGNAVPVKLAQAIGKTIIQHVNKYRSTDRKAAG